MIKIKRPDVSPYFLWTRPGTVYGDLLENGDNYVVRRDQETGQMDMKHENVVCTAPHIVLADNKFFHDICYSASDEEVILKAAIWPLMYHGNIK